VCNLLLSLEEPTGLFLGEFSFEYILQGEQVHLIMRLEEHIAHKHPLLLPNLKYECLLGALCSLLSKWDSFLIPYYSFVSLYDALFTESISTHKSAQSASSMTPEIDLTRQNYISRIGTKGKYLKGIL
jgi:hypothetical protein